MKKFYLIIILLLFPTLTKAEEGTSIDSLIISLKEQQQVALNDADIEKFKQVAVKLERLSTFGERDWLINYYLAYNYYRMSTITQDKGDATKYIEEAKKLILKSIEQKDDFVESHALYSSILGLEIGLKPHLGMINGVKSGKEIAKAYKLEAKNPRVYLVDGIGALNTPPIFGGGIDKAVEKLTEAKEIFEIETSDRGIYPDWGKDEVYIWLGITFEKKEEVSKALQFYKKTLEVNPDNGWAKKLIHKIEK